MFCLLKDSATSRHYTYLHHLSPPDGLPIGVASVVVSRSISVAETTVSDLTGETHFHGIAVDPRNPDRLYLATHHGFFAVGPDGVAERISETEDDLDRKSTRLNSSH